MYATVCVQFYTFNTEVGEERPPGRGKEALSPQDILLLRAETGTLGPRNPLQRVTAHKDDQNSPTPLEVLSDPPQGEEPPFNNGKRKGRVPWFKAGLEHLFSESAESGTFPASAHPIVEESADSQNGYFCQKSENRWLA